jgi:hypothetical protein
MAADENLQTRRSPLAMSSEEFRAVGHELVDTIASFLDSLQHGP